MEQTIPSPNAGADERRERFNREPMRLAPDQSTAWHKLPKTGVSWAQAVALVQAADAHDGERRDVGLTKLSAYVVGPTADHTMALAHRDGVLPPTPLRETAFRQLCARIGAPSDYVAKLPGRIQAVLVDHGLRSSDIDGNLLRCAAGEARALLSDRYAALDNSLVIGTMAESLDKHGLLDSVKIVGLATGTSTVIRCILPTDSIVVPSGVKEDDLDHLVLGFDVGNGEIGNRAVSVIGSVYRPICENGLRNVYVSDAHKLRHIGDPARLAEAFMQAVPSALAAARGTRQKLNDSIDRMVTDALSEIDGLRQFGLSLTDTRDIARDVAASRGRALPDKSTAWTLGDFGPDPIRVWDVVNAATHIAQSRGVDARLDIEEAAGRYLDKRTK